MMMESLTNQTVRPLPLGLVTIYKCYFSRGAMTPGPVYADYELFLVIYKSNRFFIITFLQL